jgi:hypothetical protein
MSTLRMPNLVSLTCTLEHCRRYSWPATGRGLYVAVETVHPPIGVYQLISNLPLVPFDHFDEPKTCKRESARKTIATILKVKVIFVSATSTTLSGNPSPVVAKTSSTPLPVLAVGSSLHVFVLVQRWCPPSDRLMWLRPNQQLCEIDIDGRHLVA